MNVIGQLFGNPQQLQDYQNFATRYRQGAPWEGYSDQEVQQRYNQVVPNLPPDIFHQSASQAFQDLTPEQRIQLGQMLINSARQQGVNVPASQGDHNDNLFQDPNYLANVATSIHHQQPGLLGQLLAGIMGGGAPGSSTTTDNSLLNNPIAKAALAGITAMAVQKITGKGLP